MYIVCAHYSQGCSHFPDDIIGIEKTLEGVKALAEEKFLMSNSEVESEQLDEMWDAGVWDDIDCKIVVYDAKDIKPNHESMVGEFVIKNAHSHTHPRRLVFEES